MIKALGLIRDALIANQPLIQIVSAEEKRVESYLRKLAPQSGRANFLTWDLSRGLSAGDASLPDSRDPNQALQQVIAFRDPAFFVFNDLNALLSDPEPVRRLRECYSALKSTKKTLFLLSPDPFLPDNLRKEVETIAFDLPDFEELEALFHRFLESMTKAGMKVQLNAEEKRHFVVAVQGLTQDEAHKAFLKAFQGQSTIHAGLVDRIHQEKKKLLASEGVLEYFTHAFSIDDLGGVDKLKDWLKKRQKAFSQEARDFGLDRPRGVLNMGISGCGKSLSAKVISSLWKLPLFRMDMNLVYSGIAGPPEAVFSRSLKTMDALAPAILWIDEIESGISDKHSDSVSSRILGFFLTWMQEHTSDIFIAATANRIDLLPPELLRRGRFDQIFFFDLPSRQEREDIFCIHLQKRGNNLDDFNLPQLAQITKGWTGSEIEQVIISGMYEAFNENRKLSEDDLFVIFGNSVPLSTTMEEQIKKIRSWAHNRAVRASSDREY